MKVWREVVFDDANNPYWDCPHCTKRWVGSDGFWPPLGALLERPIGAQPNFYACMGCGGGNPHIEILKTSSAVYCRCWCPTCAAQTISDPDEVRMIVEGRRLAERRRGLYRKAHLVFKHQYPT